MIVSLDRLTDPEIQRAIDRAQTSAPAVTVTERGNGHVRASVTCDGTCGSRQYHDGTHDVVLRWDLIATCDCPAVHGCCKHIAALWAHEGGAIPDKPMDCAAYQCGGQLMYWNGGNGHAAQCPRVDDPEDRYEAPAVVREDRPARKAVAMSDRKQKMIAETRPVIQWGAGVLTIARPCGCAVYLLASRDFRGIGRDVLPLSPFEGCPEHYDSTLPPAPDQVRARQEAL